MSHPSDGAESNPETAVNQDTLTALHEVLRARQQADPDSSYVAALYAKGINKILEKVGEEAVEVVLAGKDAAGSDNPADQAALINEVADLWFHSMVLLAHLDASPTEVLAVLAQRFGISGHDEKAARTSG